MIFKQWKYKTLELMLIERGFSNLGTYFCGYVKVPECIDSSKLKWHTPDCSGLDMFDVFGGVTWFGPLQDVEDDSKYIGFDTAHYCETSLTEKDAKKETEHLADQLYDYFLSIDGYGK